MFKVYGDTQADRDRVLCILEGDMPELDMTYMEQHGKRFANRPEVDSNALPLTTENIAKALKFIHYICSVP